MTFKTVDTIPPINRSNRSSKYDPLFEAVEAAAPKAVVAGEFEEADEAANLAAYLRSIAPEGVKVAQRGGEVFVTKVA